MSYDFKFPPIKQNSSTDYKVFLGEGGGGEEALRRIYSDLLKVYILSLSCNLEGSTFVSKSKVFVKLDFFLVSCFI